MRPCACSSRRIVPEVEARLRIESHRGLVEKDHARLVDERARDHEPLLLAARELITLASAFSAMPSFSSSPRARARDRAGDAEVRGVEDEVLAHVEAAVRIRALRHDTDALAHQRRLRAHVGALDDRGSGRRDHARGADADRGRLPRAVGAEQAEELAGLHLQVERLERDDLAAGATGIRAGCAAHLGAMPGAPRAVLREESCTPCGVRSVRMAASVTGGM